MIQNHSFKKRDFNFQKKYDEGFILSDILPDNQQVYSEIKLIEEAILKVKQRYTKHKNFVLLITKQYKDESYMSVFLNATMSQSNLLSGITGTNAIGFPLYLYLENSTQTSINPSINRTPNLNKDIVQKIAASINLSFVPEKEAEGEVCFANNPELRPAFRPSFAPIDLLDYIYAVLHSPTYRTKYKEFLKIDFPRVPYPQDADTFWELVQLGGALRQIHLLESPVVEQYITQYPEDGSNVVEKPRYEPDLPHPSPPLLSRAPTPTGEGASSAEEIPLPGQGGVRRGSTTPAPKNEQRATKTETTGRVYINETQYFANVPSTAWAFYIGGYQPAQKWLKDRKGRALTFDDILHYQKIIVALTETHRLMQEIDKIEIV